MTSKLQVLDVVMSTNLKQLYGKWLLGEEHALPHLEESRSSA